ncbi:hypothetical protein [Celeribacter halophilus]|uniref:hypothetical protein n=1 Tax=Celeribacter halophilus TaxID=576117 RepID=UPI003A8DB23E
MAAALIPGRNRPLQNKVRDDVRETKTEVPNSAYIQKSTYHHPIPRNIGAKSEVSKNKRTEGGFWPSIAGAGLV